MFLPIITVCIWGFPRCTLQRTSKHFCSLLLEQSMSLCLCLPFHSSFPQGHRACPCERRQWVLPCVRWASLRGFSPRRPSVWPNCACGGSGCRLLPAVQPDLLLWHHHSQCALRNWQRWWDMFSSCKSKGAGLADLLVFVFLCYRDTTSAPVTALFSFYTICTISSIKSL